MNPTEDPITCHVLDTTTGLPAVNLAVTLELCSPISIMRTISAVTDENGRIKKWADDFDNPLVSRRDLPFFTDQQTVWVLKFDTEGYFGKGKTFFPEVEVRFIVQSLKEHYHVPLLLGPWSYTTYKGT